MTPKWTVAPMDLENKPLDRYKAAAVLRNAERAVLNGNITEITELLAYITDRLG
jgi:hypothetical protein